MLDCLPLDTIPAIGVRLQLDGGSGSPPQVSWQTASILDPTAVDGLTRVLLAARPDSNTLRRDDSAGSRPPSPAESSMGVGELELAITPGNSGTLLLLLLFEFILPPPSVLLPPAEIAAPPFRISP